MIVVIGGGPAGRYAAMRLAGAGKEVTLVDRRREGLGGQCLHQGCMVICALNDVARTMEHLQVLHRSGIITTIPGVTFRVLVREMQEIIRTISGVIFTETRDARVQIRTGNAALSGREIIVDGERVDAESIIIATGSKPVIPQIPGAALPGVYTAHTLLSLPDLPKNLIIIGGGAIAAEIAYIFSVFGTGVTILARSSLLRSFPGPLVQEARRDLHRVKIIEHTRVSRICGEDRVEGVIAEDEEGTHLIEGDAVLLATGMVPETTGITGFELTPEGHIRVSDRMETSVQGVYAVGDVTGTSYLTPLSRRQGRIAAEAILGMDPPPPLDAIPQAIKLRNDLAWCGDQESRGLKVTIPSPAGPGTFWAVRDRATGRASMSMDPETGKILGMLEASPYASVVSAYHAMLINNGRSIDEMGQFIEVHPSSDGTSWTGRYLADHYHTHR
jgi:dihydrolipoamide dehydrogenase